MKTYCISDIHGHLDNLIRFTNTLEEDDRVYVLGDVIDKGPESIKCLEHIMNDKRFTMLLGNHEYMMFNVLSLDKKSYEYQDAYDLWINWNKGQSTLYEYESLSKDKQKEIYDYIKNLPLNIPNVKVKDKTFYLVHSCPRDNISVTMADVKYNKSIIASYVWDRVVIDDTTDVGDINVIAGHTPTQEYVGLYCKNISPAYNHNDINKASYIDIDGGLATSLKNAKLIALCLDDLSYNLY